MLAIVGYAANKGYWGYAGVWVIVVSLDLESVSYTAKLLLSDNIVCGKKG